MFYIPTPIPAFTGSWVEVKGTHLAVSRLYIVHGVGFQHSAEVYLPGGTEDECLTVDIGLQWRLVTYPCDPDF